MRVLLRQADEVSRSTAASKRDCVFSAVISEVSWAFDQASATGARYFLLSSSLRSCSV